MAVRSKTWDCGLSLAGNAGSNPAGGIYNCLLWVFCFVRWWPLRLAVHLSRGVWCAWVWSWSLDNEEALAHEGLLRRGGGGGRPDTRHLCKQGREDTCVYFETKKFRELKSLGNAAIESCRRSYSLRHQSRDSPSFMVSGVSWPCSQKPATCIVLRTTAGLFHVGFSTKIFVFLVCCCPVHLSIFYSNAWFDSCRIFSSVYTAYHHHQEVPWLGSVFCPGDVRPRINKQIHIFDTRIIYQDYGAGIA